MTLTNTNKNL